MWLIIFISEYTNNSKRKKKTQKTNGPCTVKPFTLQVAQQEHYLVCLLPMLGSWKLLCIPSLLSGLMEGLHVLSCQWASFYHPCINFKRGWKNKECNLFPCNLRVLNYLGTLRSLFYHFEEHAINWRIKWSELDKRHSCFNCFPMVNHTRLLSFQRACFVKVCSSLSHF